MKRSKSNNQNSEGKETTTSTPIKRKGKPPKLSVKEETLDEDQLLKTPEKVYRIPKKPKSSDIPSQARFIDLANSPEINQDNTEQMVPEDVPGLPRDILDPEINQDNTEQMVPEGDPGLPRNNLDPEINQDNTEQMVPDDDPGQPRDILDPEFNQNNTEQMVPEDDPGLPRDNVDPEVPQIEIFSFLYIFKSDMTGMEANEKKFLQTLLFNTQMESEEDIDIVKSRYLTTRSSYQIVIRGSDSVVTNLLMKSLRDPYKYWNPAVTQAKDNVFIVSLFPPMSTHFLDGRLMRVIAISIRECPKPVAEHIQLAGPPRINGDKVTLTLELSSVLNAILKARKPSYCAFNMGGIIRFVKASAIAQREELATQMSLLSVDMNTQ